MKVELQDWHMQEFYARISPFLSLDLRAALELFLNCDLEISDLIEEVYDFKETTCTELEDIDIAYVAYTVVHRYFINELNDKLIISPLDVYGEFLEVHGNYMCSCFEISEENKQKLIDAINENELTKEDFDDLALHVFELIEIAIPE